MGVPWPSDHKQVGCVLAGVGSSGENLVAHQVPRHRAGRTHERGLVLGALSLEGDQPPGSSDAQPRAQTPGLSLSPVNKGLGPQGR